MGEDGVQTVLPKERSPVREIGGLPAPRFREVKGIEEAANVGAVSICLGCHRRYSVEPGQLLRPRFERNDDGGGAGEDREKRAVDAMSERDVRRAKQIHPRFSVQEEPHPIAAGVLFQQKPELWCGFERRGSPFSVREHEMEELLPVLRHEDRFSELARDAVDERPVGRVCPDVHVEHASFQRRRGRKSSDGEAFAVCIQGWASHDGKVAVRRKAQFLEVAGRRVPAKSDLRGFVQNRPSEGGDRFCEVGGAGGPVARDGSETDAGNDAGDAETLHQFGEPADEWKKVVREHVGQRANEGLARGVDPFDAGVGESAEVVVARGDELDRFIRR